MESHVLAMSDMEGVDNKAFAPEWKEWNTGAGLKWPTLFCIFPSLNRRPLSVHGFQMFPLVIVLSADLQGSEYCRVAVIEQSSSLDGRMFLSANEVRMGGEQSESTIFC